MGVAPGTRIGPYEVVSSLGAGGMGEVYRARDPRLHRDVALKVLPDAFAADPQRMARFVREAQMLAALQHPNIAAILGLEDGAGQRAIVMELVEGRELSGPLPVEEALTIARQIAEAIEAAHDRGVIHRDLKPANIKVTPDGAVKVLDFGLAKALQGGDEAVAQAHLTHSPTMSLGATQAGVVLGTAAYMAPEQAKGRPADRRADIWAFGVILHELLTGRRLFGGDTAAETLASVMKDPITFDALPADTPSAIRRLLARCLERDVRRRLQAIGEARVVLDDVLGGRDSEPASALSAPRRLPSWLPWSIAVAAVAGAGLALSSRVPPAPRRPATARYTIAPPSGTSQTAARAGARQVAISPDGHHLAFVADDLNGAGRSLWLQPVDALTARKLEGTTDATYPFWSPDSQHVAYFANGRLLRIAVSGGGPLTVAAAPDAEGGSWSTTADGNGFIVFAPTQGGPLYRVAATGGATTPVTTLADGESGHVVPQVLPDGERVLYTVRGVAPGHFVQAMGATTRTRVGDGTMSVIYAAPGYLLYVRDGTLLAHRVDPVTLAARSEPFSLAQNVRAGVGNARSAFDASDDLLVYRSSDSDVVAAVRFYERDGRLGPIVLEEGSYSHLDLSPDGTQLAVAVGSVSNRDFWLKDLVRGVFSRLTTLPGQETQGVWSPDSRQLAFMNGARIFSTSVGSGVATPVPTAEGYALLEDWTPDGRFLIARTASGAVGLVPAPGLGTAGAADAKPGVVTFSNMTDHFQVSPDGQWVAYMSDETGRVEVMLAPFPAFSPKRQISVGGGAQPRWRGDGKELFFHSPNQEMFVVEIVSGEPLVTRPPKLLFRTNSAVHSPTTFNYDVTPDGQRFLLREPVPGRAFAGAEPLYVVVNWAALVK